MNTFECHYCYEGEQRAIMLVVFTCFCRFWKGALQKISHFDGKDWLIKPVNLLNRIGHTKTKTRQFSISLL